MTTVKIIETGETQTLSIIDPKTGLDWSGDLLGNYDAYEGYDEADEIGLMTKDTYSWWADLLPRYEAAAVAVEDYLKSLRDDGDFRDQLDRATSCDLEDVLAAMISAIERHRA